jgi:hypothetical protein
VAFDILSVAFPKIGAPEVVPALNGEGCAGTVVTLGNCEVEAAENAVPASVEPLTFDCEVGRLPNGLLLGCPNGFGGAIVDEAAAPKGDGVREGWPKGDACPAGEAAGGVNIVEPRLGKAGDLLCRSVSDLNEVIWVAPNGDGFGWAKGL